MERKKRLGLGRIKGKKDCETGPRIIQLRVTDAIEKGLLREGFRRKGGTVTFFSYKKGEGREGVGHARGKRQTSFLVKMKSRKGVANQPRKIITAQRKRSRSVAKMGGVCFSQAKKPQPKAFCVFDRRAVVR